MKEIKSLRKAREKHFLNKDGTITAYLYDSDIHYLKDGVYEEIDNSIVNNKDKLVNTKNAFKSSFSKDVKNNNLVDIKDNNNNYLKLNLKDNKSNNTKLKYQNNEVAYNNILDNIDFNYQVESTKVKESIILKDKNNIPDYFDFIIDTNLNLSLTNNKVEVRDQNKNIFIIDTSYMWDNNNNYNYNINYELLRDNNSNILRLNLDKEWLKDASYPVVIDPTIITKGEGKAYDAYICSNNNLSNKYLDMIKVGVDKEKNIYRALMKFNLPTISTGCEVIRAKAYILTHPTSYNRITEKLINPLIDVHELNSNWNESSVSWSNLNNKYNTRIEDYFYGNKTIRTESYEGNVHNIYSEYKECELDITNLVKRWYAGKPNNGIMLKYHDEVYNSEFEVYSFISKDNATLTDDNGNPVKTLINNVNPDNELISDKHYYIRLKGTDKYLDCDFINRNIKLKGDDCSHDAFIVHKIDPTSYYFKIANLYITASDLVYLSAISDGDAMFELIKQDNGSYKIKSYLLEKYLCNKNGVLTLSDDNTKEEDTEFYFEDTNTKMFIESKAEYTSDGRFITKTVDTLGKVTNYDINEINGLTNSIKDASDVVTSYTYNDKDQITKVVKNEKEVNYEYNTNNLLSKITSGNKDYTFSYDDFLNTKEIKINDNTLITNEYAPNNGNLIKSTYGNNSTVNYEYDELDRLVKTTNDNNTIINKYDNIGNLAKIKDNNATYSYYYDIDNKLNKYNLKDNNYNNYEISYKYDENSNITKKDYTLNTEKEEIEYLYNGDDAVTKVTFDNHNLNYTYDYLGRLTSKNIDNQALVSCSYVHNGNKTSTTIKSMQIGDDLYEYKYDNLYNITDIYLNKELIHHYEYDNFNQLLIDIDYISNKKYAYNYDMEGNIRTKTIFDLTNSAILKMDAFLYQNNTWEDQLIRYNKDNITYDAIGNPITIGSKNLTWINGRQLKNLSDTNLNVEYEYDKDGIRNKKKVNNEVTTYFTEENKIIFENKNNNMIYYIRDEEGTLIGFKYNNEIYYYQKNMQEDIIGITNSNHELLCRYDYDAWGYILSIKDKDNNEITDLSHIAYLNPFRYRSY